MQIIKSSNGERNPEHIALMIHGFYVDQLETMLTRLPPGGKKDGLPGLDLYVSTCKEKLNTVQSLLARQKWPSVYIASCPNRGRDIAPFLLHLLPAALKAGHCYFIKVHTKKSPHLHKGNS